MSVHVLIDDNDVTDALAQQFSLDVVGSVNPAQDKWFDLLKVIKNHSVLKTTFFQPGIHTLTIKDDEGRATTSKMFIKSKYTARNR